MNSHGFGPPSSFSAMPPAAGQVDPTLHKTWSKCHLLHELESKLLGGSYTGDYIGDYHAGH